MTRSGCRRLTTIATVLAVLVCEGLAGPAAAEEHPPRGEVDLTVGGRATPAPAPPITVSAKGWGADVAVGEDGMVHAAWLEQGETTDVLRYCRIPRGTRDCSGGVQTLPLPGERYDFDPRGTRPQRAPRADRRKAHVLIPSRDRVLLLASRRGGGSSLSHFYYKPSDGSLGPRSCDGCVPSNTVTIGFLSTDDGASFAAPRVLSTMLTDTAVVVDTPAEDLIGLAAFGNRFVPGRQAGFEAGEANLAERGAAGFQDDIGSSMSEATAIAAPEGRPVLAAAAESGGEHRLWLRRFRGDVTPTPDALLNAGNWSAWEQAFTPGFALSPRLAVGPAGTFLMYQSAGSPLQRKQGRRGWKVRDVSRVGAPGQAVDLGDEQPVPDNVSTGIEGRFAHESSGDIAQAGNGTLTAAWAEDDGNRTEIRLAVRPSGGTFGRPQALWSVASGSQRIKPIKRLDQVRVDAAADGGGAVIWQEGDPADFRKPAEVHIALFGAAAGPVAGADDNVSVSAIEVTQGVQSAIIPTRSPDAPDAPLRYPPPPASAHFVDSKDTIVHVWAHSRQAGVAPPHMVLRVKRPGAAAIPLDPVHTPATLPVGTPFTPADIDHTTDQPYVFRITAPFRPQSGISLEAEINPADGPGPFVAECATCRRDNFLRFEGLTLRPSTILRILPLRMFVSDRSKISQPRGAATDKPDEILDSAYAMMPVIFEVPHYLGAIDLRDIAADDEIDIFGGGPETSEELGSERAGDALDEVEDWADDNEDRSGFFPIGFFPYDGTHFGFDVPMLRRSDGYWMGSAARANVESVLRLNFCDACQQLFVTQPIAVANDSPNREVRSVAHEIGHGFGFEHAGNDRRCYTGQEDQLGQTWAPGPDGRMDGIGLDTLPKVPATALLRRIRSTSTTPYQRPPDSTDPPPPPVDSRIVHDFMSYCARGSTIRKEGWISLTRWNQLATYFQPKSAAPQRALRSALAKSAARQQGPPSGLAEAQARSIEVRATGPRLDTEPDGGEPIADGPAAERISGLSWVARDVGGQEIFRGRVLGVSSGDEAPFVLRGRLPVAAAAIELHDGNGNVLARAARNRPPTLTVVSPQRGGTIGTKGRVDLRWKASDPDGDPLEVSVDYAADGKRFSRIASSAAGDGVRLPASMFAGAKQARLRIRVHDGFTEVVRAVGPVRSLGAPPTIQLVSPLGGRYVTDAGGAVPLAALAFDDRGQRLPDRRVRWRLGKRVVLRGATGSLPRGLAAGTHRIVVEATDRAGRRSRRTVTVRVTGVLPRFTILKGPKRVEKRARTITLRVASNVPARFKVGKARIMTGHKPRSIVVRLPRRGNVVRLTGRLTSGPAVTLARIAVVRR